MRQNAAPKPTALCIRSCLYPSKWYKNYLCPNVCQTFQQGKWILWLAIWLDILEKNCNFRKKKYHNVLSNWEFFINMGAALLALSFLHNSREDGGKKRQLSFCWKTLILMGHHTYFVKPVPPGYQFLSANIVGIYGVLQDRTFWSIWS